MATICRVFRRAAVVDDFPDRDYFLNLARAVMAIDAKLERVLAMLDEEDDGEADRADS